MSILDYINDDNSWLEYLEYKRSQICMSKYEIQELEEYIKNKKYKTITNKIVNNDYVFSVPKKKFVNKIGSFKKRVVYEFNEDENMVLKLLTYLFNKKYDYKYSDNCYSFRRGKTIKTATNKIIKNQKINNLYGYKIDISNYFNSINVDKMLSVLKNFLEDDDKLYSFLKNILKNNQVNYNGNIINEEKGIMAGTPISSFLANIYLYELDEYFKEENVFYLRYSDDIVFFDEKDNIDKYILKIKNYLNDNYLTINKDKEIYILPNSKWEFLGFSYDNGIVDISDIALRKIKGKIKRAAKKIYRWKIKNNKTSEHAIQVMIRKFNYKFYQISNKNELTWCLWYFPNINTSKTLLKVDNYMQQELRYLKSGKHCKKNYNIKYSKLKELGYRPLVPEYYKFINKNIKKNQMLV